MLHGPLAHHGYDWWWHSFTAQDAETGEDKPFFIEFFVCNPALAEDQPILGQLPANKAAGKKPSYLMVKAGTWGEDACQLHRFFAWKDVNLHGEAPYQVEAADCLACETTLKGSIDITPEEAAAHPEYRDPDRTGLQLSVHPAVQGGPLQCGWICRPGGWHTCSLLLRGRRGVAEQ